MTEGLAAYPAGNVALVHDWLVVQGGAEKVLATILPLFPEAPIFSLVYAEEVFAGHEIGQRRVVTSFLNRLPFARKIYRSYLPLMPLAVEQLDLRGYDLVLSLSDAVCHGVLLSPDQLHLNYIFTPPRYAWRQYHDYLEEGHLLKGPRSWVARLVLHYLRLWDFAAAARVHQFIGISNWVASSVRQAYRRHAHVIYPPVEVNSIEPASRREAFFLTVARLVPYKKVRLIVEAFNRLDLPLVVVGDGPEYDRLSAIAGPSVTLLGHQPDEVVFEMMGRARAFIHAAEEDFGIAPVEAQAGGCPVIAYGRGGVRETVTEGVTGLFFPVQSAASLTAAVRRFEAMEGSFDPGVLRASAERFSPERFRRELVRFIEQARRNFADHVPPTL